MVEFRATLDTNVILAGKGSHSPDSPNREILSRWLDGGFVMLYSLDTLAEYIRKLREKGVSKSDRKALLKLMIQKGQRVQVVLFHTPPFPSDSDDIAFLLCAFNGSATHLVTYDLHLLGLKHEFDFKICRPLDFLRDLRK